MSDFVNIRDLPSSTALPLEIIAKSAIYLPRHLVRVVGQGVWIRNSLAASYLRVVTTSFTDKYWNLGEFKDVNDTINWCALGGSFLADFAMDITKPRIFAWGLSPVKEAGFYALKQLKGRDAGKIPTAICAPAEDLVRFVDAKHIGITSAHVIDYMSLGPAGIRCFSNKDDTTTVQFILPGVDSPYMRLVRSFLKLTGYPVMGVTSANFSGKGQYHHRSGGTHKNLDEIQKNMGFLGIPILAGPIILTQNGFKEHSLSEQYKMLHDSYLAMSEQEKENYHGLVPTSVTIAQPVNKNTWQIVRYGSLHRSVIEERMSRYNIRIELAADKRLDIGRYDDRNFEAT